MRTLYFLPLVIGCAPPQAPVELDDIMSYLFEHHQAWSTAALRQGTENLDTWLNDHQDETWDGFQVSPLSQEAVDALDDEHVDVEQQDLFAQSFDLQDTPSSIRAANAVAAFAERRRRDNRHLKLVPA